MPLTSATHHITVIPGARPIERHINVLTSSDSGITLTAMVARRGSRLRFAGCSHDPRIEPPSESSGWVVPFSGGNLCFQEAAQNRISRQSLCSPSSGLLFTPFGNFAQQLFLNPGLHLDTIEWLLDSHCVTTSRGE